ncbi:MAG: DNA adenine [Rhodospirillaceae bacterium]|nr:MAG: DNA adenine [Rhodospirillaceae bacterium]
MWGQETNTLGVRFNRDRLAGKIISLGERSEQVTVLNKDWRECFASQSGTEGVFFYADPPYYYKAEQLYGFVFTTGEHQALCDYLKDLRDPWLLSYDDSTDVRALYADLSANARVIDNTYSTHPLGGASFIGRELMYTNLKRLPPPDTSDRVHIGLSVRSVEVEPAEKNPLRIPISTTAISLATASAA